MSQKIPLDWKTKQHIAIFKCPCRLVVVSIVYACIGLESLDNNHTLTIVTL